MLDSPLMKKLAVATVLAVAYVLWREWSLAAEEYSGPDWDHATVGSL